MEKQKYLQDSVQTTFRTQTISTIVQNFKTNGFDLIFEVLSWIHKNLKSRNEPEFKSEVFRKRSTSEIIESGFVTGCTDYALVFITFMRAKGIPAKYIEAVSTKWLESGDPEYLEGHVFSEVLLNNKWYIVDPQGAVIKAWYGKRYEILAEGLDSWDIEVKNLEDLKKKFLEFRTGWFEKQVQ